MTQRHLHKDYAHKLFHCGPWQDMQTRADPPGLPIVPNVKKNSNNKERSNNPRARRRGDGPPCVGSLMCSQQKHRNFIIVCGAVCVRFDLARDNKRGPHRPHPLHPCNLSNRNDFFCYISEIHFFIIRSCRNGIKRKHSYLRVLPPPPPLLFLGGPVCLSVLSP
jgi:hypothetical protein